MRPEFKSSSIGMDSSPFADEAVAMDEALGELDQSLATLENTGEL
jgi:hypothetical protein